MVAGGVWVVDTHFFPTLALLLANPNPHATLKNLLAFLLFFGLAATVNGQTLVINEFMPANDTTRADQDGEFDDWIELYNNTSAAISLDGYYLSDDAEEPTKWAFPTGTSVAANGYLIIWADQDAEQDGLHANFRLSAGGEAVVLTNADLAILDSISYSEAATDVSIGRFPNGTGGFRPMTPTFNAANTDERPDEPDPEFAVSALAGALVINEFLAANDSVVADQDGEFEDWIELYNTSGTTIDLSGFSLSDDLTDPGKWAFPAGTTIAPDGYLIIWADQDTEQDGLHADFRLSANGETLLLTDQETALIDSISYPEQETDISYGRFPNGTGAFRAMTPTFNAVNNDGIVGTRSPAPLGAEVTLFPNPTGGLLNVRLANAYGSDLRLRLLTTDGRVVREALLRRGGLELVIDASALPDGMYFLSVADGAGVETRVVRKSGVR